MKGSIYTESKITNALNRSEGRKKGNLNFYYWDSCVRVGILPKDQGSYSELSPAMFKKEFALWADGIHDAMKGYKPQGRYHNDYYYMNGYHTANDYKNNEEYSKLVQYQEEQ